MRPTRFSIRFLGAIALPLILAGLDGPRVAQATPYWGEKEVALYYHAPVAPPVAPGLLVAPRAPLAPGSSSFLLGRPGTAASRLAAEGARDSYLEMLTRTVHFLSIMQVADAGSDFGGIREAEHMMNVIQTDNTSESIWLWSRYYELTGDNQYHQNLLNSFTYSLNHPAYLEEGGSLPTTGYYRVYNCGWAVRAEQKYRDVYHDATYKQYGDSCGNYLRTHTLNRQGGNFNAYVNPPVLSWAMGALYRAGQHESNQAWQDYAMQQSRDLVKAWVDGEPTLLGNETWAMSGGATAWGLLNSYFLAVPDSTASWLARHAGYLDNFSDPGDFQNAWNGWYAYGHRAIGLALNDPNQLATHVALTDTLMTYDTDLDGGIMAKPSDTNNMDQTWVSSYLSVFGLTELLDYLTAVSDDASLRSAPQIVLNSSPNPFQSSTNLSFSLTRAADLDLTVFDLTGRQVARLAQGAWAAGRHDLQWTGRSESGHRVPSGVYWLRLQTPEGSAVRRVVLAP